MDLKFSPAGVAILLLDYTDLQPETISAVIE